MIDIENSTDFTPPKEEFLKIMDYLNVKNVELLIVDEKKMHEFNLKFLNKDRPTDVLSFPLDPFPHSILGTIIINIDMIKSASKLYGHSLNEEALLLFSHGLLHLMGYDHETDCGQMREKEREIVEFFNLPASLIIREGG